MHISRWMAKHLYAIKTVLIGSIIHRGISQRAKFLQEVCLWNWKYLYYLLYFVYNSWWLTSPISSSAQKNDLILINSCDQYRAQDSTIGKAAPNTYKNHLCPSQKNLFVLLFSVALWTRRALKLVSLPFTSLCESRKRNGFKNPESPELPPDDSDL